MPTKSKSSVFRRKPGLSMVFGSPKTSRKKIDTILTGETAGLIAGGAVPEWALYLAWTFLVTWREFLVGTPWIQIKEDPERRPEGLGAPQNNPPMFFVGSIFLKRSADLFRFRKNPRKRKEELSFR